MILAQPLLFLLALTLFIVYVKVFRSTLLDRLAVAVLFGAVISAVMLPEVTNKLAKSVGIGRGVDLCLYLFSLATLFSLVMLYTKISRLEIMYTKSIRHSAISNARHCNAQSDGNKTQSTGPVSNN